MKPAAAFLAGALSVLLYLRWRPGTVTARGLQAAQPYPTLRIVRSA